MKNEGYQLPIDIKYLEKQIFKNYSVLIYLEEYNNVLEGEEEDFAFKRICMTISSLVKEEPCYVIIYSDYTLIDSKINRKINERNKYKEMNISYIFNNIIKSEGLIKVNLLKFERGIKIKDLRIIHEENPGFNYFLFRKNNNLWNETIDPEIFSIDKKCVSINFHKIDTYELFEDIFLIRGGGDFGLFALANMRHNRS